MTQKLKDHSTELRLEAITASQWHRKRTLKLLDDRRRLVEALRKILAGEFGNVSLEAMERAGGGSYWTSAAALLRELGESE